MGRYPQRQVVIHIHVHEALPLQKVDDGGGVERGHGRTSEIDESCESSAARQAGGGDM